MPLVASSRFGVNKRQIVMELNRNAICMYMEMLKVFKLYGYYKIENITF